MRPKLHRREHRRHHSGRMKQRENAEELVAALQVRMLDGGIDIAGRLP